MLATEWHFLWGSLERTYSCRTWISRVPVTQTAKPRAAFVYSSVQKSSPITCAGREQLFSFLYSSLWILFLDSFWVWKMDQSNGQNTKRSNWWMDPACSERTLYRLRLTDSEMTQSSQFASNGALTLLNLKKKKIWLFILQRQCECHTMLLFMMYFIILMSLI